MVISRLKDFSPLIKRVLVGVILIDLTRNLSVFFFPVKSEIFKIGDYICKRATKQKNDANL